MFDRKSIQFSQGVVFRDGDEPVSVRSAEIAAGGPNLETREVDLTASVGADVVRYDWERGRYFIERLRMTPDAWDLSRVEKRVCPSLHNHNRWSGQIGIVSSVNIAPGKMSARVQFAKDAGDFIENVWQLVRQKMLNGVSVGYTIQEYVFHPPETPDALPVYEAVAMTLQEISFAPVPADADCFQL